MKNTWQKFVKIIGAVIGAFAVVCLAILSAKRKVTNPPIEKPPKDPPKKITAGDLVKKHQQEKEKINAEVDKQSRADLIADINSRYDEKPKS